MSSVALNMKEEKISKHCLCNALKYIVIIPPTWWFEIKPKFDLQKSYLTKFYKACCCRDNCCHGTILFCP